MASTKAGAIHNASRGIFPDQQVSPDLFEYPSGCLSCAVGLDYSLKNVDLRNQQTYEQDQRDFTLGVASLVALPVASVGVMANGVKSFAVGFSWGAGIDAVDQVSRGEGYSPSKTFVSGVTAGLAYPLAGTSFLGSTLWGGLAGASNTAINNYRYAENDSVSKGALGGAVAGGTSAFVGGVLGNVAGKYLPNRIGANIDPAKPILLQNRGVVNPYPTYIESFSRDISVGVISIGASRLSE